MPLYEYRCTACRHQFEVIQSFSDKPKRTCEKCGAKVEKLISRTGFVLKGGGWYKDDYSGKKSSPQSSEGGDSAASSTPSEAPSGASSEAASPAAATSPAGKPVKKPKARAKG
jgi:putative FmdB family regulatory protein